MTLRRTDSLTFDQPLPQEVSKARIEPESIAGSSQFLGHRNRLRVPAMLQSTLKGSMMASRSRLREEENIIKSRVGNAIKSTLNNIAKSIKGVSYCQICEGELLKPKNQNLEVYMCNCKHKFSFCQSCLHHYVIYKVKNFEEVLCPHEGCPATLDTSTNFFKHLPADIQKKYNKIYQFYLASKNPDLRLCPQDKCEGITRKISDTVMVCDNCKKEFCSRCLLGVHRGECESEEVKFFQGNLHYRQCKKCKFIIEKNQGCNHMTCKCGYQFCYVCGEKWTSAHYGNHDSQGRVQPVPNPGRAMQHYEEPPCCDCQCMDETVGGVCSFILKLPIQLILIVLLLCLIGVVLVGRDLQVIAGMLFVCVLAGIFGYSFQILGQAEGWLFILGIIFFPILMIVGIVRAFQQIFVETVGHMCGQTCTIFTDGLAGIVNM